MTNKAYLFALSAAASAATVAGPQIAAAVCDCTLPGIAFTVHRTQGPETLVYQGSPSAGYEATLVQDDLWGFTTSTDSANQPQVWLDYALSTAGTYTTTATLCRVSYLGVYIACALQGSDTRTVTGYKRLEMNVPVSPNTGAIWGNAGSNTVWDVIKMRVVSPYTAFKPVQIPSVLCA